MIVSRVGRRAFIVGPLLASAVPEMSRSLFPLVDARARRRSWATRAISTLGCSTVARLVSAAAQLAMIRSRCAMLRLCLLALALTPLACSRSDSATPDAAVCSGAPPTTMLVEGFCKNGEADRCYYSPPSMDGF